MFVFFSRTLGRSVNHLDQVTIAHLPGHETVRGDPVLRSPVVIRTAARLGITPAQVALHWLLQLAPNVLLIPGTGTVAHLRENLAAESVTLDNEALRALDGVGT
jgi:pyridoxine 4-dehydrogenase